MVGLIVSNREAWIKDPTTPTSNALFAGSQIYFGTDAVSFNYRNVISYKPITKVDFNITGAETAIGDEANYQRRKGIVTYGGINALTISVEGRIDKNWTGSYEDGSIQATAGRLRQMWSVPKTYRFYDNKLGSAIQHDSDGDVKDPYASTGGIPVIIQDLSFSTSSDSLNQINFSLTLMEDKEE